MAKITASVGEIKDKDGKDFDPSQRSAGSGRSFQLIEPGFYIAIVRGLKFGSYRAAYKGYKSPASDGKWTYWKLTPDIELVNANRTLINRQDVQIGVVEKGAFVRPDGDTTKAAIWTAAQYFLAALGLLTTKEDGQFGLDFDPDIITDRVIKVRTDIGGYIKGERGYDAKEMNQMLLEVNEGVPFEFEDVPELIALWNSDNGYDGDICLKPKNIIANFYAPDLRTIGENGFYVDEATGAVFINELSYNAYLQLKDAVDSYQEPDF